jgi:hypothetical protein
MDWLTTHGNDATYRGKDNEGKTKKAFAVELAKKMAEETTSQHRTAAQVQSKIDSTATQWRAAHEWTQATGAGLKERDLQENTTTFDNAVKKRCPHCFLLLDIIKDRASTRPLATSYDGNWDKSSREGKDQEQAIDDNLPEQIVLLDDDLGASTSHQHMSAVDASSADAPSKKTPSKKPKGRQHHWLQCLMHLFTEVTRPWPMLWPSLLLIVKGKSKLLLVKVFITRSTWKLYESKSFSLTHHA